MSVPSPVLILRPETGGARTAAAVMDAGYLPIVAPLFTIEPGAEPCPTGPFDAILLTSANAANRLDLNRATPVLTVGKRTAEAARKVGFASTRAAAGDRMALAALVRETLPKGARLLAALGEDRHEDWLADLSRDGYAVTLWTAYAAKPAERLPDIARAALSGQPRPVALHFSARGAAVFLEKADEAGLGEVARAIRHVVMSEEAAKPLRAAGATIIALAETPDEAGLIAGLTHSAATVRLDTAPRNGENAAAGERPAGERESIGVTNDPTKDAPKGEAKRQPKAAPMAETIEVEAIPAPRSGAQAEAAAPTATTALAEAADAGAQPQPAAMPDVAAAIPAPPPIRRGPGWGGLFVVGIIGGVVGAGALYLLQSRLGPTLGFLPAALMSPAAAPQANPVTELEKRLVAAETALANAAPKAALQALEARADQALDLAKAAQSSAEAASKAPTAASPSAPASPDPALAERLAKLESRSAAAAEAVAKALPRLDTMETSAKAAGAPGALTNVSARLLLADRVRTALAAGSPFESELKGLAAAGVAAEPLAPLAVVAGKGAPTLAALREELRKQRRALSEENAARPTDWKDQAMSVLGRIVSIERIDGGAGETPAALVARIDEALAKGDTTAASAAWAKLPEPARRASEGFGASLSARGKAEAALKTISDAAVAALTAR